MRDILFPVVAPYFTVDDLEMLLGRSLAVTIIDSRTFVRISVDEADQIQLVRP